MSASHQKSSGAPPFVGIVFGLLLAAAGTWLANSDAQQSIVDATAGMGLPLNPGKTVATIGVFLILFPVVKMFFTDPLDEAITARNENLENTFTEAEQLRADMTQMKLDYERQLTETEANAREQIQAQIKEAQELRKTLNAEAQAQAEEYKQRAIAEIDAERQRALTDLRVNVTNLSLMATERILSENMDNDRNRRLIDDFLATAEVKG